MNDESFEQQLNYVALARTESIFREYDKARSAIESLGMWASVNNSPRLIEWCFSRLHKQFGGINEAHWNAEAEERAELDDLARHIVRSDGWPILHERWRPVEEWARNRVKDRGLETH